MPYMPKICSLVLPMSARPSIQLSLQVTSGKHLQLWNTCLQPYHFPLTLGNHLCFAASLFFSRPHSLPRSSLTPKHTQSPWASLHHHSPIITVPTSSPGLPRATSLFMHRCHISYWTLTATLVKPKLKNDLHKEKTNVWESLKYNLLITICVLSP